MSKEIASTKTKATAAPTTPFSFMKIYEITIFKMHRIIDFIAKNRKPLNLIIILENRKLIIHIILKNENLKVFIHQ